MKKTITILLAIMLVTTTYFFIPITNAASENYHYTQVGSLGSFVLEGKDLEKLGFEALTIQTPVLDCFLLAVARSHNDDFCHCHSGDEVHLHEVLLACKSHSEESNVSIRSFANTQDDRKTQTNSTAKQNPLNNGQCGFISLHDIAEFNNNIDPTWQDDPYETITRHVYTRDNQRLFIQRETGFVVTEDGRPVAAGNTRNNQAISPTNTTTNGSGNVLMSVPDNTELIDSANRNLPIFLNSTLNRAFLRTSDGRNYVTSIARGNEVFLINFRPNPNRPEDTMLIYAFRERVERGFWDRAWNPRLWGTSGRTYYQFFDMAGRAIEERYIATMDTTPAWQQALYFTGLIAASILFPPLIIFTVGSAVTGGIQTIPFVEIISRTTLGELLDEITHATVHPWNALACGITGQDVKTTDGRVIRINPRTNQLADHFGYSLFNRVYGYPIILWNNDVYMIYGLRQQHRRQQRIENNILLDSVTVQELLDEGVEFYFDTMSTYFGSFTVPKIRNPETQEFTLMNGQTSDNTNGILGWEHLHGESFRSWWDRVVVAGLFGGDGGIGFFGWLMIAVGIVLLLIALPYIMTFLKFIFAPLIAMKKAQAIKKAAKQNRERE